MYDKQLFKETFSVIKASEGTLAEVEKMIKDRKKPYRITRTALVAAIVILLLGMATVAMAYSGAGSWLLGFFQERAGTELSSWQQQLIEDETVDIGSSVTSGDISITVESALSDDYNAYIVLKVEASKGVDLGGENFRFRDESLGIEYSSMSLHCYIFEDEDGKPNIIGMLIEVSVIPLPGSEFSFRDGVAKTLTLTDICIWPDDGVTGLSDILVEGTWSFDIVFSDNVNSGSINSKVELITEAVFCCGSGLMGDSQEVLLTSFQLSTFGAVVKYEQLPDATPEALDFMGVLIIMKDGSSVELLPQSGSVGVFTLRLNAPIILDEVDHIIFPDGVTLPVTELQSILAIRGMR